MNDAATLPPPDMREPTSFAFDAESEAAIAAVVQKYPPGRQASAVLPVMYIAQEQMRRTAGSGWVPRVAMDAVAHRLGMAPIRVYEVATFYFMFNTRPVGRYHLQACTTTPLSRNMAGSRHSSSTRGTIIEIRLSVCWRDSSWAPTPGTSPSTT